MARILYGVAGEGFGHSSRSHLIGQWLLNAGHDVQFVASRRSHRYLSRYYPDRVQESFGLSLGYSNGSLNRVRTVTANVANLLRTSTAHGRSFSDMVEQFQPDLVITDFEPLCAWWAWYNNIPFISIDHEHMLTMCELEHPLGHFVSRYTADMVTRLFYVGASAYLILNFFETAMKSNRAIAAPPVVRDVVRRFQPSRGGHFVFYSTDRTVKDKLLGILRRFPRQVFHIYGFDQDAKYGNCQFRKTDTEAFLQDLASCRAVIATAGFSLLSECLYYRKRMLLLPILGQYEQMINAWYVEKLGLGRCANHLDAAELEDFLSTMTEPWEPADNVVWPDNERFFATFERVLAEVQNSPPAGRLWSRGRLATAMHSL